MGVGLDTTATGVLECRTGCSCDVGGFDTGGPDNRTRGLVADAAVGTPGLDEVGTDPGDTAAQINANTHLLHTTLDLIAGRGTQGRDHAV